MTGQPPLTAAFCARDSAKRGLAHGRAGREDDELGGLQAGGLGVEVGEPGGHPGHTVGGREPLVERAEHLLDETLERFGAGLGLALGDLEDLALGQVEVLADLEVVLVALVDHLARGLDHPPRGALALDDLGVVDDVVDRRHPQGQLAEEGQAADRVELAQALQLGLDRDRIDRLGLGLEVAHGHEHGLVLRAVEVLDLERVELRQHLVAQEHAAQDRGFGVEVMGEDPPGHGRRIYRGRSAQRTPARSDVARRSAPAPADWI
jgi:hypothetical protein